MKIASSFPHKVAKIDEFDQFRTFIVTFQSNIGEPHYVCCKWMTTKLRRKERKAVSRRLRKRKKQFLLWKKKRVAVDRRAIYGSDESHRRYLRWFGWRSDRVREMKRERVRMVVRFSCFAFMILSIISPFIYEVVVRSRTVKSHETTCQINWQMNTSRKKRQ